VGAPLVPLPASTVPPVPADRAASTPEATAPAAPAEETQVLAVHPGRRDGAGGAGGSGSQTDDAPTAPVDAPTQVLRTGDRPTAG
jgi:hypothetical protein